MGSRPSTLQRVQAFARARGAGPLRDRPAGTLGAVSSPLLLLPDFLLILLGWVICRRTSLDRRVWDGVERLVYYLLFPVLLFNSIVKSPLHAGQLATLAVATLATIAVGIALALALGRWPGVDRRLHASGAQVAYRFNSYIALALAERLGGAQGLAWMALLIAISVPLCNVAAVWPLARHGGHSAWRRSPAIRSSSARSRALPRTSPASPCPTPSPPRCSASAWPRCRSG